MCDHCAILKLAISKGEKLSKNGLDQSTTTRLSAFVGSLKEELAALQSRPDHKQ